MMPSAFRNNCHFATMSFKRLTIASLLTIASFTVPLAAIASQLSNPPQVTGQARAEPTARQVLAACVQNRAETLPNPFSDVPGNHWAFKAVLTMYYCGAYRQATPSSLIERTNQQSPAQTPQAAQ